MWYLELIMSIGLIVLLVQGINFVDLASDERIVNAETVNLMEVLMDIQERSRDYHYMESGDFRPICYIYSDKYEVVLQFHGKKITHHLPEDIKINFYDSGGYYVFRQESLYNGWPNKTIKVYKNNVAKYIIINRVGRIRVSKYYKEPS